MVVSTESESESDWPMGMSDRDYLDLIGVGGSSPFLAALFPGHVVWGCLRKLANHEPLSEPVFLSMVFVPRSYLSSYPNVPQNKIKISPFLPQVAFGQSVLSQQQKGN